MSSSVPGPLVERAVEQFEREARLRKEGALPRPPRVITISRQLGSGGRRIAEVLARTLGWPLWDREVLNALASESRRGYEARMFEALDERTQSDVEAIASSLLQGVDKSVYLYLLPRAILTIAQTDSIILGRGAHLLLPKSVRVRIVASLETRVRNLVQYERLDQATAQQRIAASDQQRTEFLRDVARIAGRRYGSLAKRVEYDLVLSTDRLSVEEAASVILTAATEILDFSI